MTINISTQFVPTHFFARYAQWEHHVKVGHEDKEVAFDFPYINLGAGVINLARCQQVEEFLLNSKAEWFMNIDCDETWDENSISRLLDTDSDIVSAVVHSKQAPHTPNFYYWDAENGEFVDWDKEIPYETFEVDAVGFGFIGIRRPVLEVLWHKYGATLFDRPRFNKWNNIFMGEDVSFCYKAGETGYKIHVNPEIKVYHLGYQEVGRDNYLKEIMR